LVADAERTDDERSCITTYFVNEAASTHV
jgi:hypothetical protein